MIRAKQHELENVVFLEPLPKAKIVGLMKSADVGLQCLANVPAFYNGTSPNKFFDYLAAGLPVIINYPGWLAAKTKQNNCGFATKPDDANDFADVLQYASNHRDELVTMGENAKDLAKLEFNREDLANQWVNWVTGTKR